MTNYTETIKIGPVTTPTLLVQHGAGATFSWSMVMPEGDPLSGSDVVERAEQQDDEKAQK